jgi:hypothetical protein
MTIKASITNIKWKLLCVSIFAVYLVCLIAQIMGYEMSTPYQIFVYVVLSPFALIGLIGIVYETIRYVTQRVKA